MIWRILANIFALAFGLALGASVTMAFADTAPCDCVRPVVRQPNGLPK